MRHKTIDVNQCLVQYVDDYLNASTGSDAAYTAEQLRNRLKEDYSKFMDENNNTYTYAVNDNYDLIVEISNLLDMQMQQQFDMLVPEHERNLVLQILELQLLEMRQSMRNSKAFKINYQKMISEKMYKLSLDT